MALIQHSTNANLGNKNDHLRPNDVVVTLRTIVESTERLLLPYARLELEDLILHVSCPLLQSYVPIWEFVLICSINRLVGFDIQHRCLVEEIETKNNEISSFINPLQTNEELGKFMHEEGKPRR